MSQNTAEKTINTVIAENLAHFMAEKKVTQSRLAELSSVGQTTISLYLDPSRRMPSKSGKEPSAKVTELALLASALGIEMWQLMRPMTPQEREMHERIESAYRVLKGGTK